MKKYYLVFLIILAVAIPVTLLVFTFLHKKGQEIQASPKTKIDSLVPTVGSYNVAVTRQHLPTNSKDTEHLPTREPGSPVLACLADSVDWKRYSDPSNRFFIDYPSTMDPHVTAIGKESEPLVSQTQFIFGNHFYKEEDVSGLGLYFWIFAWQNPNRLTLEAWAKQNTNPHAISAIRTISVAGREGVMVQSDNMIGTSVSIFVADKDLMYRLEYSDLSEETIPNDIRACWASISSKMLGSFALL